ncbi:MAG: hydantoinase B/oxoprolinase family protein [Cyanobacteria bacterium P01_C01_bin.89]
MQESPQPGWQFWIDRGGTFTDIVAQAPDGERFVHKLLSENPERYADAPVQGIREVLIAQGVISADEPVPLEQIDAIKMGTTVATNALLERKGDRVVLAITEGFADALKIGYQNRPDLFALHIQRPEVVYETVVEVPERLDAQGTVEIALTPERLEQARSQLQAAYDRGIRSCAVVLMHGYRYPDNENQVAAISREIGFTQVSVSHKISPLMKLVGRGDTTTVDAYLSPILRRYVAQVERELQGGTAESAEPINQLFFMQSNGGLTAAADFQGKDSVLSGPAGGIVGAVQTCEAAGFDKIVTFDMGGTSTDVARYAGEYERQFETTVAGVRLRAPMMAIHTVAAGGGSILQFDGQRYRVGPDSAGANPGPAAYGRGGPLTVTDCNVMLGKLQPAFFPQVFGSDGDRPLDTSIVQEKFIRLAQKIDAAMADGRSPEEVAAGFLAIAVETMANAIKKISIQRGYDLTEYVLCCFGGAGGQHACLIAESLGMSRIFIHPYAGVLSAFGMGLADQRKIVERAIEATLEPTLQPQLTQVFTELSTELESDAAADLPNVSQVKTARLRYAGTDSPLVVAFDSLEEMKSDFETQHRQQFGFILADKPLVVEAIALEIIEKMPIPSEPILERSRSKDVEPNPIETVCIYTKEQWSNAPVFQRDSLQPGDAIEGPALIIEPTGTNVVEPNWIVKVNELGGLIFEKLAKVTDKNSESLTAESDSPDPVLLEIFNGVFGAIADQMGLTLQKTSYSVNIKERLDFSCAIFDSQGQLVANAPHMPVHLGSMGESVLALTRSRLGDLQAGDVYISNNPYNGGTHLPDITAISPVFLTSGGRSPSFYVASRGHHADIGGITPGSMPPTSTTIDQEGILLDNHLLVRDGEFLTDDLTQILSAGPYPVRNITQNIADLQAQIAANQRGVRELQALAKSYGDITVLRYMQHIQDNAESCVRRAIATLRLPAEGSTWTTPLDNGSQIQVKITPNPEAGTATIDFTGTSSQQPNNFNAPRAIAKAAVLYVFRTLVADNIPLNAGCLKPLDIIIPAKSILSPTHPAAVVAGNVETSQAVVDTLYAALGILANSQGTMNNFTFGNDRHQYYETICGGSGAGCDLSGNSFPGTDAVQTHMTNSRLTDPEVLEWRYPVLVEKFAIRPNSGGAGQYPGGNGVIRRIRFLETMTAGILSQRRILPPKGINGGYAAQPGETFVDRHGGDRETLKATDQSVLHPGDVIEIKTPGGGGYGA